MFPCSLYGIVSNVYHGDRRFGVAKGRQANEAAISAGIVCRVFVMCRIVKIYIKHINGVLSTFRFTVCGILRKQVEEAYFTVEASLILPMVMLFTVMMIFLAFYSYDRCVMEHSAYEAALRGTSSHYKTAQEAESAARIAAARLVEGKLYAMRDFGYDVSVDADSVTVAYHCVLNMPFVGWLYEYVPDMDMTLDVSRSAKRLRPARTIRDWRVLNRLMAP